MSINKLIVVILFIFLCSFVFAQETTEKRLDDIEAKLNAIDKKLTPLTEQLQRTSDRILNFMNTYGDIISQQTQQLRSFQSKELGEVKSIVIRRTDPMYVTFPIVLMFLGFFAAMAWLYAYIKGRDAVIKWYNRRNILCTCGTYAKFDKDTTVYECKKCGKTYKQVVELPPTPTPSPKEKPEKKGLIPPDLYPPEKKGLIQKMGFGKPKEEKKEPIDKEKLDIEYKKFLKEKEEQEAKKVKEHEIKMLKQAAEAKEAELKNIKKQLEKEGA